MQETDSLHVLSEHPFISFIIGALLMLGLLTLIAHFVIRHFDTDHNDDNNRIDKQ